MNRPSIATAAPIAPCHVSRRTVLLLLGAMALSAPDRTLATTYTISYATSESSALANYDLLRIVGAGSVTGGEINAFGYASIIQASVANAIVGGTQKMSGQYSTLTALGTASITGGSQELSGNYSVLSAQATGAIRGGHQYISGPGAFMEARRTGSIDGGTAHLYASGTYYVRVADGTTALAKIIFEDGGGTLSLGASTTIGSIASGTTGAGVITTDTGVSSATLNVQTSGSPTFSGKIQGGIHLRKSGSGTLTLSGLENTHSGGTTVDAGTLILAAGGQTGAIRGTLTINPGATVVTSANNALGWGAGTKVNSLVINGGTLDHTAANSHGLGIAYTLDGATMISNAGVSSNTSAGHFSIDTGSTISVSGATPSTITGRVDLRGEGGLGAVPFTVADGSRLNITAGVSSHSGATLPGPVGIIKNGPGVLALTGANSYTGNTTVNAGLVEFNSASALGASNKVVLNGGGLRWASGTSTDISARLDPLGANGGVLDTNGNNVALATALSGSGALTKSGSGTLTLSTANTHTGGTVVNAGVLELGGAPASGIGILRGSLTINSGATVRTTSVNALGYANGAKVNTVTINGGTLDHTAAQDQGWGIAYTLNGGTLSSNGGVSSAAATSKFAFGGPAGANTSVTVTGSSTSTIAGHVNLRSDNGNANVNFTVGADATLDVTAAISGSTAGFTKIGAGLMRLTGANTYAGPTSIQGGRIEFSSLGNFGAGAINLNGGGLRWASGNTTDISSRLSALGAAGGTLDTAGNNVAFASALTGDGALTKSGAGTLTLNGANTYSGGTVVDAGTLAAGHVNAFGSGSIRVNGGVLDFGGFAIANALDVRGGTLSGLAAYAGTQTVSGAQSYTGAVGGSLVVESGGALDTTGATFTGPTTLQSGATLKGTGTLASLTVQSGATLAPGNSPGLLTVNGDLTLDSGSFTEIEIAGLTRGASDGYDAIDVAGLFTAGGTLTVSFLGGYTPPGSGTTTFDLFNFSSFGGTFATVNLPTVAGYTWNTANLSLDGTISLVSSAIPEPGSFAAFAAACALGSAFTRRRRRA